MKSTEKELTEMNDEILKMRKSLTNKGILADVDKHSDHNESLDAEKDGHDDKNFN